MPERLTDAEANEAANADWARTFLPATTNLSQRRKYAQDIAEADATAREQADAQFERNLAGNKGLRDLVMGREKMAQQERFRQRAQENADRQFKFAEDKRQFDEEMRLRQLDLNELNARRMMQKDLRDTENAKRVLEHTSRVEDEVQKALDAGLVEGSPGFAAAVAASIINNPYVDKDVRESLFKGSKIDGDPADIIARAKSEGLEVSGASYGQNGNLSLQFRSPKAVKEQGVKPRDIQKEIVTARDDWIKLHNTDRSKMSEEEQADLDGEIKMAHSRLKELRGVAGLSGLPGAAAGLPAPASGASAAAVSAPQSTPPPSAAKLPPGFSIIGQQPSSPPPLDERE